MIRKHGSFAVLLSVVWLLVFLMPVSAAERILEVRSEVHAQTGLPVTVQERMQKSVAAIAEQLLSGRVLPLQPAERREKERVIHEVFDKVLVGYSVRSVRIEEQPTACVHVELVPWDDLVQEVRVEVRVDGMPPEVERLVRRDLADVGQVFEESLSGLPLAAADWTNGVLKKQLRGYMEQHLPEFWADFDVIPQTVAQVTISVYPKLPVIRSVDLNMRSDTIPNMFLLNHRTLMQEKTDLLVGVPVAFVHRHEQELGALFADVLDQQSDFKALSMTTRVTMDVGERTSLMSRSDSKIYRIRIMGWADIGRDRDAKDDVVFRLHAGRKLSSKDEAFVLLDLMPQDVEGRWALGYQREAFPETDVSLRYDFSDAGMVAAGSRRFLKDWMLRYEYHFRPRFGETGLRYRLHDFLSVEYVVRRKDNWLRLIGFF